MDGKRTDRKTKSAKNVGEILPQNVQDGYETPDDKPERERDIITWAPVRPKQTENFTPNTRFTFPKI